MGVKSLALGLAAGYVLGARAGRQRYEQIAHVRAKAWHPKAVHAAFVNAGAAGGAGSTPA